jgi:hypothetical protein
MERLQDRMQQMEERHRQMLDRLMKGKDDGRPESEQSGPPASPQSLENTI